MHKPQDFIEIFLQPGEYYFADRNTRIRTVLGSCIAITLWHPKALIGGMCHYMLPTRQSDKIPSLDGRYGDEALLLLIKEAVAQGTNPMHYEIKVFGGGDMFPGVKKASAMKIGLRNIDRAMTLLGALNLPITAHHVGGHGHRSVIFDVWSGYVWLKHERQHDHNG
jgi:chemotaxis protein CheD